MSDERPEWLDRWSDYPHGGLYETYAREIVWYAISLEARIRELEAKLLDKTQDRQQLASMATEINRDQSARIAELEQAFALLPHPNGCPCLQCWRARGKSAANASPNEAEKHAGGKGQSQGPE